MAVTGSTSQNDAIEIALRELLRRRRLTRLAERAGQVELTLTPEMLDAWRSE